MKDLEQIAKIKKAFLPGYSPDGGSTEQKKCLINYASRPILLHCYYSAP
jgi:hypothetical protein